ncbi:stonustoxin subunit alpha-like [Scomber japonicus]|uniref:stonustoxin subunit alpha-like n=1 Tax=Scomber japonicus TaxID=13676 RepID=UPI00230560A3|nr:stonustoxin subunit alpha-like [Scomber japonicus]
MDIETSKTITLPALGRPFNVGMLYDCRNDSLVPGVSLWDHDDIVQHIYERPQFYNDFEIVASESTEDKSSALNVDASLMASFMTGLVEVEGSAKYLKNQKTSKNQARVTLKYEATTKFQELSMDHLGRGNVKHPYVFEKGLATHVVTAVLYGAQAFFVFDREVSKDEDRQDIQGKLKMTIKKIPKFSIEGEGNLQMEDHETKSMEKFSCKYHGDFFLENNPVSFQDAIQVYQNLSKILDANRENVVPMKVWLLPLTCLHSGATQLVHQISAPLVRKTQSLFEDFSELEMRSNDALKTTIAQQFPEVGKKLKTFKELCFDFKLELQRDLAKKLPSIRGGGEEEDVLSYTVKKIQSSLFKNTNLSKWMDCKEREIYNFMSFMNIMKNTKIVPSENDLYKEIVGVEHAVCFVFPLFDMAEPFLSALSDYSESTQEPQTEPTGREKDWFFSRDVPEAVRDKAKLFSDFAEANKEDHNIKFLTVALRNKAQKGPSICLYKEGFPVTEDFEPPSKPEEVSHSVITHNSVTLNISPPQHGVKDIISYSVEYCVSGEDEWQQTPAAITGEDKKTAEIKVIGLKPAIQYMFRCRAMTSVGVGPATEVPIHAYHSR